MRLPLLLFFFTFCLSLSAQQEKFHIKENHIKSISETRTEYNFPDSGSTYSEYFSTDFYDRKGILTKHISEEDVPECDGAYDTIRYDPKGRIVSEVQSSQVGRSVDFYKYNSAGNLIFETQKKWNWEGKISSEETTTFVYDTAGRLIKSHYRFKGDSVFSDSAVYVYQKNLLVSVRDGQTTVQYSYNSHDSLLREETHSPGGDETITYRRDSLGRMVYKKTTRTDFSEEETIQYDNAGRISVLSRNGDVYEYKYDANGRLVRTLDSFFEEHHSWTDYVYNTKGDLTEVDEFDENGHLSYSVSYEIKYY